MPDNDMSILEARAIADYLEDLRAEAVGRGVGYVSIWDLAERIKVLREIERRQAEAAEEMLRRVARADRARNYGIGEDPC